MKQVLLLLTFLILGAISQPVYAYQDAVCHVMTSDSISLYVHVKGEGPMCLYLHGGPGSGSTWMEAVSGHMLEKRFTMVYLDQRGVCKSETPKNDDFSFARQIQDWEEVRQALGIDHWLLMIARYQEILASKKAGCQGPSVSSETQRVLWQRMKAVL